MTTGRQVAEMAREWLGTPYHHQASLKGVGCDCLGLLRGVYREVVGPEPEQIPNYSPGWDEVAREEKMQQVFERYMRPRPLDRRGAGLCLLFRMRRNAVAKHCGIMTSSAGFVHSHLGHGVVEIELSQWWSSLVVGVYAFPGVR